MTERRSDDDEEDGRAAGSRSQTRAVPDAATFPPRNTFAGDGPLRPSEAGAAPAAPRPAPGSKPVGTWGQTIALGAAVPPPDQPPAPKPVPKAAVPERAVVVIGPAHTGQPRPHASGPSQAASPPPPTPQTGRSHKPPPAAAPAATERSPAEVAAHAAEPLRVPSGRPPPTPYKAQRGAPKGTLLMTGLGADGRPSTPQATPEAAAAPAARPAAAQTVRLGGDGRIPHATPIVAPASPAVSPRNQAAPPGATRPMRAGARERDELHLPDPSSSHHAAPAADLSFAQTMPSVPPEAMPPESALAAEPPRQPPRTPAPAAPARASQSAGRQEIRLQLAAADFVQGAPSSTPAGVPRRNPMVMVTAVLVLLLIGVIGWLVFGRQAAPAPEATAPAAETPTPAVVPTPPIAPEAQPSAAPTATPTPAPAEPTKAAAESGAEPAARPVPKTTPRRAASSGKSKSKAAPNGDVGAARDALRSLQRDPVLKVKPSKDDEDDDVLKLVPADAPSAPPMPGE